MVAKLSLPAAIRATLMRLVDAWGDPAEVLPTPKGLFAVWFNLPLRNGGWAERRVLIGADGCWTHV